MFKTLVARALPFAAFALSSTALADQCAWITQQQAQDALKLIQSQKSIYTLCKPCGETQVKRVRSATAQITRPDANFYSLQVNTGRKSQQDLDLAYTYIKTGSSTLTNLAGMVGCPAFDVDAFVSLENLPAGTSSETQSD